jgi:hypothetical protein
MISLKTIHELVDILENIDPNLSNKFKKIKTPINFFDVLNIFGYNELPKIIVYKDTNIKIEICDEEFHLLLSNNRWMTFSPYTFEQIFELYSHYSLAEGHCICTGLGFGLREKWLLSNKKVSKVTVLENSKEIIEYHKKVNPNLVEQIEIINCNASEFKGKCDTLLLDHYEYESTFNLKTFSDFDNIKICSENIDHKKLWFWPIEEIISRNDLADEYATYQLLRKEYQTLPNIEKDKLISYCKIFNFFSR